MTHFNRSSLSFLSALLFTVLCGALPARQNERTYGFVPAFSHNKAAIRTSALARSTWSTKSAVLPRQKHAVVTKAQWGEEEDEYFATIQDKMTAEEKMKDPLVLIGLFSVFVPFILLGVAYAAGWVGN